MLVAQDRTKPTLMAKLENCNATINGKYRDKDTVPNSEIDQLVIDCGKVISFDLSFPASGVYISDHIIGHRFFPSIRKLIAQQNSKYTYLVITDIEYTNNSSQIKHTKGITIVVRK